MEDSDEEKKRLDSTLQFLADAGVLPLLVNNDILSPISLKNLIISMLMRVNYLMEVDGKIIFQRVQKKLFLLICQSF